MIKVSILLNILIDQLYSVSKTNNKSDRMDYHLRGAYCINVKRDRSPLSALFIYVLIICFIDNLSYHRTSVYKSHLHTWRCIQYFQFI